MAHTQIWKQLGKTFPKYPNVKANGLYFGESSFRLGFMPGWCTVGE